MRLMYKNIPILALTLSLLIPGLHTGFLSGIPSFIFLLIMIIAFQKSSYKMININYINVFLAAIIFASVSLSISIFTTVNHQIFYSKLAYYLRIILIYTQAYLLYQYISSLKPSNIYVIQHNIYKFIIFIVAISILYEVIVRSLGLDFLIEIYKARDNTGGIDSLHYARLSGFFSYPGDMGAIIVLCIYLTIAAFQRLYLKLFFIACFVIALMYTQSRAAMGLFLGSLSLAFIIFIFNKKYLKHSIYSITMMSAILISIFIWRDYFHDNFPYMWRIIDNLDYYLLSSKRAQEILGILRAEPLEILFGLHPDTLQPFYESEWAGSIARLGLVGSFWLLFITIVAFKFLKISIRTNKYTNIILSCFFVSYISIYCMASAGLSRSKLEIIVLTTAILHYYCVLRESQKNHRSISISRLPRR